MKDNETLKAAECCINRTDGRCMDRECPLFYKTTRYSDCKKMLVEQICELIDRKDAEIKEQDKAIIRALELMGEIRAEAVKATEERLQAYKFHYENLKAEIVREFADRLKAKMQNVARLDDNGTPLFIIGTQFIDNLVKEMTENERG